MKNSILIKGKNYISSRRCAEITKYTNDYIGQLCRGRKIFAQRVGRLWFVDEESLMAYKKDANKHFTDTQGNQTKTIISEKIIISAFKQLSGSDMVSVSLPIEYDTNISKDTSRPYASPINDSMAVDTIDGGIKTPFSTQELNVSSDIIPSIKWKITYASDSRPLLPVLHREKDKIIDENISNGSSEKPLYYKGISDEKNASRKLTTDFFSNKNSRLKLLDSPRISVALFMTFFIIGIGVFSLSLGPDLRVVVSTSISRSSEQLEANVIQAFNKAVSVVQGNFSHIITIFTGSDHLSLNTSTTDNSILGNSDTSLNGIVVVPRDGGGADIGINSSVTNFDDVIKSKIKNSFSDQVEVKADGSGTAGVITPVFRENKGKDFIYVMVPVKPSVKTADDKNKL